MRFKRTGNNGLLVVHSQASRLNAGSLAVQQCKLNPKIMSLHLRVLPIIIASFFLITINAFGQSQDSSIDSTFAIYMNQAIEDLNKHSYSDSIQRKYSDELYEYFKQNPDHKTGQAALMRTFGLWGNLGEAEKMEEAMTLIENDSNIWRQIIVSISNAYYRHDQRTTEDYIELLEELRKKLTDPESKSEVLFTLARHHNPKGNNQEVIKLAREMIEINANDYYVNTALGFQTEAESLGVGAEAPLFDVQTVQGSSFSLSDAEGKVIILEFWATWCGPCMPDIPHLKEIHSEYSKNDVQIIGISLDSNADKLKDFLIEKEMNWPQILQPDEWDDQITKLYNVYVIPRNFIIGPDGTILAKDKRGEELKNEIAKLLKQ